MKIIRTIAMLVLACGVATGFPLSTTAPSFKETFNGGADSFDLNLHSLTLMPYQTTGGGNPNRCYYHVRPIPGLPVDMAGATVTPIDTDIPIAGLPAIYGIALSKFQIKKSGEVVLLNSSSTSSITLRALKSDAFQNSTGFLKLGASRLTTPDGRLAIQFDYDIDPEYWDGDGSLLARPLVRNVFQLEIFPNGMIRYSYFSVDVTLGEVGLISSISPTPGADLDYSTAILKAPDVVSPENAGTANIALELPLTGSTSFQYATVAGSAVPPSDYTTASGASSIAIGAGTANLAVPIVDDTLHESPESFTMIIHAPGNPDWIFAEPRIWILDDDAHAAGSGPRIDLAGNRVIVLPPDPSAVTITGFRLLSLTGGTLTNPLDQSPVTPNSIFNLEAGAAGLIASGLGVHLTVEAIHSSGTSVPVGFDLDGNNPAAVFNFTGSRFETIEGGFASLGVSSSQPGASVFYQIFPITAQPSVDYAPLVKTLEFRNGLARIEIPVFTDRMTEGDEEFLVRLVNPSPGSFVGPISRAKVVIKDGVGALWSPAAQVLPDPRPSGRVVNRNQATSPVWRFVGEPLWRPSNSQGWNVREGLHQMDFRVNASVSKLYMAPETYLSQQSTINDLDVSFTSFTPAVGPTVGSNTGSLQVNLLPAGTTGQWRRVGETTWRNTGAAGAESAVPVGTQLIEFKDTVSGYDAPTVRPARILTGSTSTLTAAYQIRPPGGVDPAPIPEPDLRVSNLSWRHIPISSQTGNFRVSFEYKPSGAGINSQIGLSAGLVATASELSAPMLVNSTSFQGWNNTAYGTTTTLAPILDQWYFVEFQVNPATGKYDLHVTPPTGARTTIRSAANFRASATELNYLAMSTSPGSANVRSLRVENTHPASTWKIIEFPDQVSTFDLALELQVRTAAFPSDNPFQFLFGLSDGRAVNPTSLIGPATPPSGVGPVAFPQPDDTGAVGRYPPTVVRLQVNLATDTYEVRGESGAILSAGPLSLPLTKANHLYLKPLSSFDVQAYSISDSVLPPAFAPPTGTGVNVASNWTHLPIAPQTGRFSLTCDIRAVGQTIVSGDLIDSLVGLSSTKVNVWSQISVALRAKLPNSGGGSWDAYSSTPSPGGFVKEGDLPIVDGKLYHAVFHVDVPNQTFRVEVSPADGGPVVILEQASFRGAATELRYLTLRSVQGRLEVGNVRGPLPHPLDSPPHFTGQIESPNGFGTGTVVADHAVLTSARLVFDSSTLTFTPRVTWRRSGGGYSVVPDACEPSHVILASGYAAALLNTADGDPLDVAVLAFRPLDVPESDNAPGGGCFSGFLTDDGSGGWTSAAVKSFPSFPVTGIAAGNPGKIHATDMGAVVFTGSNLLKTASGIRTPPGSEGAAVFVQGADQIFRPAAVCIGAAGGIPRFRTIDAALAEAIYQANSYQRQPGILQDFVKGGVYYIPQTLSTSADPNRAHILSNAIPPAAKWTLKRYTSLVSSGGQAVSVEPGSYQVTFGEAPPGYTRTGTSSITNTLTTGTTWNLPAVYTANPPSSYGTWVDDHYDEFELETPLATPASQTPWLGVDNLTAYAFGFDPNLGPTRFADPANGTPGYPRVTINRATAPPTILVEFLRRVDPDLVYEIQYSDSVSGWSTLGAPPQVGTTQNGWQHVSWTMTNLPGQPGRKFVRTRVTLGD